ncbi:putative cofactor-binding repeat protein [Motilibacter peucedani]|uniref:Putative cofactor-binding repeat protein n=1 Tax=Motilibacter peucedani TaxID=598650 RepID=A0A420XLC5_9ACTN|nr:right-handed parallel beta-helix repeat-containing protein [Motilibacter peucedani]RKS68637.1 putative cofactor-binding repeat protein [Motilibacter peucedani]
MLLGVLAAAAGAGTVLLLHDPADAPRTDAQGVVHLAPGDSWAGALSRAAAGATLVLDPGSYDHQVLTGVHARDVTLRGADRAGVVVDGIELDGSSGVTLRSMTVRSRDGRDESAVQLGGGSSDVTVADCTILPLARSGVDLFGRTHGVRITGNTIDGSGTTGEAATNGTSRGIHLNGAPYDRASWVADVTIEDNDISHAGSDLVLIAGARQVVIRGNTLHDPQPNDDHNDGIQDYGSDGVTIEGNTFRSHGDNGPDQGIILGRNPRVPDLTVTRTVVKDNVVEDWRGTGILLAGTDDTVVTGNVVRRTGTDAKPGSSFALQTPDGLQNTRVQLSGNDFVKVYDSGS